MENYQNGPIDIYFKHKNNLLNRREYYFFLSQMFMFVSFNSKVYIVIVTIPENRTTLM